MLSHIFEHTQMCSTTCPPPPPPTPITYFIVLYCIVLFFISYILNTSLISISDELNTMYTGIISFIWL